MLTRLNKGGMANVYLGQTAGPRPRWVAIKTLLPDLAARPRFVEMFRSEGALGKLLHHPNIVETHDIGVQGEGPDALHYLVLGYVHGRDLGAVGRHFRKANARLPLPHALYIAHEVLQGLDYAHARRDDAGHPLHLVNRDVSPANVMVGFDGSVRLIDFGIAQATLDFRSQIGSIRGKLSYMSPEQIRGLPVDRRSDLFSLSVVLYQLLTGIEPFLADSEAEQMELIRAHAPPRPSDFDPALPPALDALLMKGLAKDPAARFQDAAQMRDAVDALRDALDTRADQASAALLMGRAFQADIDTIEQRVLKGQALLRERGLHFTPALLSTQALAPPQTPRRNDSQELQAHHTPPRARQDTPTHAHAQVPVPALVGDHNAAAAATTRDTSPLAPINTAPRPHDAATTPHLATPPRAVPPVALAALAALALCIAVLGAILLWKIW